MDALHAQVPKVIQYTENCVVRTPPYPGPRKKCPQGLGPPTLHLNTLANLRDEARVAGRYGDAISAEVNRGKALGFYVTRSEAGKPGDFTVRMTLE